MPCPETICLGLDRRTDPQVGASVEEEDTRIAGIMKEPESMGKMKNMVEDLAMQIREYQKYGFTVQGLVGINGSPTCAVETTWHSGGPQPGPGVFVALIKERLAQEGIDPPMRGIRTAQPDAAMRAIREILQTKGS